MSWSTYKYKESGKGEFIENGLTIWCDFMISIRSSDSAQMMSWGTNDQVIKSPCQSISHKNKVISFYVRLFWITLRNGLTHAKYLSVLTGLSCNNLNRAFHVGFLMDDFARSSAEKQLHIKIHVIKYNADFSYCKCT